MATFKHPKTGVILNIIKVKRPRLTYDEAVTAHILRKEGRKVHTIAAMMGTNPGRVIPVLHCDEHPKAIFEAEKLNP